MLSIRYCMLATVLHEFDFRRYVFIVIIIVMDIHMSFK
jgi:hypothetical protein